MRGETSRRTMADRAESAVNQTRRERSRPASRGVSDNDPTLGSRQGSMSLIQGGDVYWTGLLIVANCVFRQGLSYVESHAFLKQFLGSELYDIFLAEKATEDRKKWRRAS